jgi:hypothetical protein
MVGAILFFGFGYILGFALYAVGRRPQPKGWQPRNAKELFLSQPFVRAYSIVVLGAVIASAIETFVFWWMGEAVGQSGLLLLVLVMVAYLSLIAIINIPPVGLKVIGLVLSITSVVVAIWPAIADLLGAPIK